MSDIVPEEIHALSEKQREYLSKVLDLVKKVDSADELQLALYNLSKDIGLSSKEAFAAIYRSFIGKDYGPRAAWFLLSYPKEKVIKRLKEASK